MPSGFTPGEPIVVDGARILLSIELKSLIPSSS
jgi:hypothetical protein